ncbi:MAG: transporter [Elusimicrobiales bacterium]|nr:transporter [Elusimicrobiales bacterium]
MGDVSLETKFWVASRGGWDLALKPGFSLPAGDDAKGLGAGKGQAWVIGVAGHVDGPREYYLNAGYKNNSNSGGEERNIFSASAMAAHKVLPGLFAAAELAIETNADKGAASHPVQTVLGLVWETTPSLDLSAGARFGLNDSADDFGLVAGLTIRF